MNKIIIGVLSIAIPLVVAILFFTTKSEVNVSWLHVLPSVNATLNGTTSVVLLLALYFIKNGNEKRHEQLMKFAFILGALFLVSYVLYHATVPSTIFGDTNGDGVLQASEKMEAGSMRSVYLGILLSHILLAVIALPLILTAFYHGLNKNREKHRRIVKFTFPIWLYVSITGVLVYILISPYY
ncbi:MAG: DUF420 domain-containing protein [Cyclobacteriaceae bacterium]|nr:DUF420 domain-containing protein [Cyclobacteriaceae bacterium]